MLKIFKFFLGFSVIYNFRLTMIRLISKFMTPQASKKAIAIHILLNISIRNSNQIIKFSELIEYNNKNHFS